MTATGQTLADLNIPELLAGTGVAVRAGLGDGGSTRTPKTCAIDDDRVLRYDTLVYAMGSVADTAAVPGSRSTRTP